MAPEIERLARKYVWWETPERALERRTLFLCQLMQLGTHDDVREARRIFGDDAFKTALAKAPPGVLDAKSWNFWHLYYGLTPVPPRPERREP